MSHKRTATHNAGCNLEPILQVEPYTLSRIFGAARTGKHDVQNSIQACFNPWSIPYDQLSRCGPAQGLLANLA